MCITNELAAVYKQKKQPTKLKLSRLFLVFGQDVLEHLWLVVLLCCWSVSWALATWTLRASVVAAWATVVATVIAAWATVTLLTTWTSVSAWLALRLDISLRLLEESLARKSHLAALLIDLEELNVYLVTNLENVLYLLSLLPSDL